MSWTIGAILVILWLLSFVGPVVGWVHLILAIATIGFVVKMLMHDPQNSWA